MRTLTLSLLVAVLVVSQALAQVPRDWAAFSGFDHTKCPKGAYGGLGVFNPRLRNFWFPITNVPVELSGKGNQQNMGSNSLLVRPRDGALLVGEFVWLADNGQSLDIHLLHLKGLAVTQETVYSYRNGPGWINQMAWLPDERVVFTWSDQTWATSGVAILDLGTGKFANLNIRGLPPPKNAQMNALAVSPDGRTVYLGANYKPATQWLGRVFSFPVVPAPLATLRANIPGAVMQMAIDNDDNLLVGDGRGTIHKYNVSTWAPMRTIRPLGAPSLAGLEVDRLTGDYLVFWNFNSTRSIDRVKPTTRLTRTPILTNWPTTGYLGCARSLNIIAGIAMNNSVEKYGFSYPGKNKYKWAVHPGPFPRIGTTYPLTVTSAPGSAPGVIALGLTRMKNVRTRLGFNLLLAPILTPYIGNARRSVLPLPIPNNSLLRGVKLLAQSIHLETPLYRASRGLQITIL